MVKALKWLRDLLQHAKGATAPLPDINVANAEENKLAFSDVDEEDVDLSTRPLGDSPKTKAANQWRYDIGWATHTGVVREHNEDALYVNMGFQDADQAAPSFGLFMVSDGMGGHLGGEKASMLALRTAATSLISDVYVPLLAGQSRGADQPSITDVLRIAMQKANSDVTRMIPGSGCTLTFAMTVEERVFLGHVGDSRAYLIKRDGTVEQLTRDHSFVNRLIELGELLPEEADLHPQRNVLYRAIGQAGNLDADVASISLEVGQVVVLCSDGLWNMVSDEEIATKLVGATDLSTACRKLVSRANEEGGPDNITIVAFRLAQ